MHVVKGTLSLGSGLAAARRHMLVLTASIQSTVKVPCLCTHVCTVAAEFFAELAISPYTDRALSASADSSADAACCCCLHSESPVTSHQPEPNPASIQWLLAAGPLDGCSRRMQSTLPILTAHGTTYYNRGSRSCLGSCLDCLTVCCVQCVLMPATDTASCQGQL